MDDADLTDAREAMMERARLENNHAKVLAIPPGTPGDCELCGEWSGRLVNGACAPCRDRHKLP